MSANTPPDSCGCPPIIHGLQTMLRGLPGVVQSIVPGDDSITVDNTDPANPKITAKAGGPTPTAQKTTANVVPDPAAGQPAFVAPSVTSTLGVAVGTESKSVAMSVAVGAGANASLGNAVAVGPNVQATASGATAVGVGSNASKNNATALGGGAAQGIAAIAIGGQSIAGADSSIAIGPNASVATAQGIAIGGMSRSEGASSVAVGYHADAQAATATAIGAGAVAKTIGSIAIGNNVAEGAGAIVVGSGSSGKGEQALAMGAAAQSPGARGVAFGRNAVATGDDSIAIGNTSGATSSNAIAIGVNTESGFLGVAVGGTARALESSSIAIGNEALALQSRSISIGETATTREVDAIAIGNTAEAYGPDSVALGAGAIASRGQSVAIGSGSLTDSPRQVSFGRAEEPEIPESTRLLSHVSDPLADSDAMTLGYMKPFLKQISDLYNYATLVAGWTFTPPVVNAETISIESQDSPFSPVHWTLTPQKLFYNFEGSTDDDSKAFIDWGDGSPVEERFMSGSQPVHTYQAAGEVVIRVRVNGVFGMGEWAESNPITLVQGVPMPGNAWTVSLDGGATLTADGTLDPIKLQSGNMASGFVLALATAGKVVFDFGQRVDMMHIFMGRRPDDTMGVWDNNWSRWYFDAQIEDFANPGTWLSCNWMWPGPFTQGTPPAPGQVSQLNLQGSANWKMARRMRFDMSAGACLGSIAFQALLDPNP